MYRKGLYLYTEGGLFKSSLSALKGLAVPCVRRDDAFPSVAERARVVRQQGEDERDVHKRPICLTPPQLKACHEFR